MEDWSPEKEKEDNPEKLAKEQIRLGKEVLHEIRDIRKKAPVPAAVHPVGFVGQLRPSFEEIAGACRRTWEKAKEIAPDAPDGVRVLIFQRLIHAAEDEVERENPRAGPGEAPAAGGGAAAGGIQ